MTSSDISNSRLWKCLHHVASRPVKFLSRLIDIFLVRFRQFAMGLAVGAAISLIVTALAYLGHYKPFENPITDLLQKYYAEKSEDIALIFISKNEYLKTFKGVSPLNRRKLAEIVEVLIKFNPRAIALDIDLSDETADDKYLVRVFNKAIKNNVPIITTAQLKPFMEKDSLNEDDDIIRKPYLEYHQKYDADGVPLFFKAICRYEHQKVFCGGVEFALDTDDTLRKAFLFYNIFNGASSQNHEIDVIPSFPLAVYAAFLGIDQKKLVEDIRKNNEHELHIKQLSPNDNATIKLHLSDGSQVTPRFVGNYRNFYWTADIEGLLDAYGNSKDIGKTVFTNKLIFIGGSYDARDFYMTPLGRMSGVEALANISQSLINQDMITHLSLLKALLCEITLGAIVAIVFVLVSRLWATILCLTILLPLVISASLISYATYYYWFDFIPTAAGVFMHGWISKHEKTLEHALEKVKRRGK